MRAETQNTVDAIRKSLRLLAQRMDWETAPHRLEEMNAMIEDGDLWSDPSRAQKLMRDRQVLSDKVETYRRIDQDLKDSVELIEAMKAAGMQIENPRGKDSGAQWLAKASELAGASWTHPNQISPEAAAEVFQMLATPTADESTGEIVDEPTA